MEFGSLIHRYATRTATRQKRSAQVPINDEFRSVLDSRHLAFEALLETVTAPAARRIVVLHLPDLSLRSLAFVTGDAQFAELDSADPQARQAVGAIVFGSSATDLTDWNENFATFHLEQQTLS